jgi:D-amino-acid dehydrogenase
MHGGLRLAGTVEFAALDAPADPRRSDILFDLAEPYLPGLSKVGATRWMGNRPVLPDSLPAIGAAARHPGVFYNFGHHHVGLTHAAASARILAAVIAGRSPPVDVSLLSLDRFRAFPAW